MDYSVIDDTNEIGNLDQLTKDLSEAAQQPSDPAKNEAPAKEKPSNIPDKFWDADKGEVLYEKMAQSYTTLESAYGRMANDLGTQRKLTDRLLDLKRADDLRSNGGNPETKPELPKIKGTELLDDPAGVINRVVETVVQQRDQKTAQQTAEQAAATRFEQFAATHPDYETTPTSPEFVSWVNESRSRQRLATIASRGDVDAADDLLTEYKSRSSAKVTNKNAAEEAALEAARKAGLENGGAAKGASTGKTGKTYRRIDLLRLKQDRPDDYYSESYQAEILAAYAEGRVK